MTATATPAVECRQCAGCGETFPIRSKYGRKQKWCSERCRRAQYDRECADCGARLSGTDPGRTVTDYCRACASRRDGERRRRERHIRLELIAAMWNDGMKRGEIASALGIPPASVTVLISCARAAGIEVAYRRPDSVAHARTLTGIRQARALASTRRAL